VRIFFVEEKWLVVFSIGEINASIRRYFQKHFIRGCSSFMHHEIEKM